MEDDVSNGFGVFRSCSLDGVCNLFGCRPSPPPPLIHLFAERLLFGINLCTSMYLRIESPHITQFLLSVVGDSMGCCVDLLGSVVILSELLLLLRVALVFVSLFTFILLVLFASLSVL